jgi:Transposase
MATASMPTPWPLDDADLDALLGTASGHGVAGLVIDQPGSIAQLAIAVAARRSVPVAYVPGLVMPRAADLYPGEAKTDRRDAYVLPTPPALAADRCTGWTPAATSCSTRCGSSTALTSTSLRT